MTIQWQGASFLRSFIPRSEKGFRKESISVQDSLNRIKIHSSGFKLIDKAIQRISKGDLKAQVARKIFNDTIDLLHNL